MKEPKLEKKEKIKIKVGDSLNPEPAANGTDAEGAEEKEEKPQERLERAEKEAKENFDRFLRATAEFENYKKRMVREKEEYRKFANESLLRDMLPVVDNLERALNAIDAAEHQNPFAKGVELTLSELLKVFEKFAVKPISTLHQPFDPVYHQAVMQEASDEVPDNTVTQELQKGYLIHDRLLRPAMVVVSKGAAPTETNMEDETSKES